MKTKYIFDENKITAQFVSGNYILLAFAGTDGICKLYISSVYNPEIVYWYLDVGADEILSINGDTSYYYLGLNGESTGAQILKSNPVVIDYYIRTSGITEKSIDFITDITYIYFLNPGDTSGINAKIVKYNKTTRIYVETIDLPTINYAKKIDIDEDGVFWIVAGLDEIELVKVWQSSGEVWNYQKYTII